jgi:hypothetical protein
MEERGEARESVDRDALVAVVRSEQRGCHIALVTDGNLILQTYLYCALVVVKRFMKAMNSVYR